MTEREILIANNRDQSKYRIVTGAETLGELQDAIARNEGVYKMVGNAWVSNPSPINISGLTFTEGITKTQLLARDSALPTNVQFKGQTTNNLVMLLTNTTKQIRSGAVATSMERNRKNAYAIIKEMGPVAQEEIKILAGKNYTQIKTDDLWSYIDESFEEVEDTPEELETVRKELKDQEKLKEVVNTPVQEKAEPEKKLPDVKEAPHAATVEWFYDGIKKMATDHLLFTKDIVVLADLTTELALRMKESEPKISASDLDDMMESIAH